MPLAERLRPTSVIDACARRATGTAADLSFADFDTIKPLFTIAIVYSFCSSGERVAFISAIDRIAPRTAARNAKAASTSFISELTVRADSSSPSRNGPSVGLA